MCNRNGKEESEAYGIRVEIAFQKYFRELALPAPEWPIPAGIDISEQDSGRNTLPWQIPIRLSKWDSNPVSLSRDPYETRSRGHRVSEWGVDQPTPALCEHESNPTSSQKKIRPFSLSSSGIGHKIHRS